MYQLIAYIKFLFSSTNQHGVHSPFVYNFVTKCLYSKVKYTAYNELNAYRNTLKSSSDILQITDLGEGSKTMDPETRSVRQMAKVSSSAPKEFKLLYRVTQYFNFNTILELGTSLGLGTYAFALANKFSEVTTVEGCSNTSDYAKSQLNRLNVENVNFLNGDFAKVIPNLKRENYDCIYFDGHHNKEATIKYFEALLPKAHNESVFIFDDIYWSKGMAEAWAYIKAHNAVKVTLDCFYLGFVFFRKEQVKEHFKIRM